MENNNETNTQINKMDRKIVKVFKNNNTVDDGFVNAKKNDLISMIWEITKDTWAFVGGQDAEQRLQRDVAVIIRGES